MKSSKPFLQIVASDLMSRDVLVVPQAMSLRTAARLLAGSQVTGAPVVDEQGCCVGVISSTDFLRWTGKLETAATDPSAEVVTCAWQIVEPTGLAEHQVADLMTHDPVTVAPSTPVHELARMMLDARIRRVIVLDEHHRPVGVVTATDILAAVAYAGVRRAENPEPAFAN